MGLEREQRRMGKRLCPKASRSFPLSLEGLTIWGRVSSWSEMWEGEAVSEAALDFHQG